MTKDDVAKMFEGQDEFGDYPTWTKTVDQINEQVREAPVNTSMRCCRLLFVQVPHV